jgi:hypothetical protein
MQRQQLLMPAFLGKLLGALQGFLGFDGEFFGAKGHGGSLIAANARRQKLRWDMRGGFSRN